MLLVLMDVEPELVFARHAARADDAVRFVDVDRDTAARLTRTIDALTERSF